MTADRDLDRVVRSWLREDGREDADRVLDLVLDHLDTTPQRRAGWPARRFSSMNSNPVRLGAIAAAGIVIAIVGFTAIRSGDLGEADRSPSPSLGTATPAPSAAPLDGGVPTGMLDVQYVGSGTLRFFPAGDAACTSIPVDGACFQWELYGLVEGRAAFADDTVSLTADRCSSCEGDWADVAGSTTILEIRPESVFVVGCNEGPCISGGETRLARVGLGLPFPPEQTYDEPQRYGWPAFDNVITFTVPAGRWDASGPMIHAHVGTDATVEFRFAHICRLEAGEPSSVPLSCEGETYAPQGADEVAVVVAGYQGWYRELPSGESQAWILDFDGWWVSIELRISGDVEPAVVDEAMELLESIEAAPRD
jgi:hypothetical protein